jgi:hypothetical protein
LEQRENNWYRHARRMRGLGCGAGRSVPVLQPKERHWARAGMYRIAWRTPRRADLEREKMSKLTDQLATVGIHNAHNFAGKGNVFIAYQPYDSIRRLVSGWKIARPGFQIDPETARYDHGCKTFVVFGRADKDEKFEEAKAWASAKYGIKEWARTPFGSWMDAEFVKRRLAELKRMVAEKGEAK